jgi:hypothetical protein
MIPCAVLSLTARPQNGFEHFSVRRHPIFTHAWNVWAYQSLAYRFSRAENKPSG